MMFKTFSLLVPLRGHPERRARMWESIWRTVSEPIEVVFRLDDDDEETLAWALSLTPQPVIVRGPQLGGYGSLPKFFNEMARAASGDLLMCGNDDMVFVTDGWSSTFLEIANMYPDGIFDLGCMTYPAGVFPFSCVSRFAAQKIGFLNDERLTYSDIFLRDVMGRFERAVLIPRIIVQHVGVSDEVEDATLVRVKMDLHHNAASYWALHHRCVDEAVSKLRAA